MANLIFELSLIAFLVLGNRSFMMQTASGKSPKTSVGREAATTPRGAPRDLFFRTRHPQSSAQTQLINSTQRNLGLVSAFAKAASSGLRNEAMSNEKKDKEKKEKEKKDQEKKDKEKKDKETTSSSGDGSSSGGLPVVAIVFIVIGCVIGFVCIVGCCCYLCKKKRRKLSSTNGASRSLSTRLLSLITGPGPVLKYFYSNEKPKFIFSSRNLKMSEVRSFLDKNKKSRAYELVKRVCMSQHVKAPTWKEFNKEVEQLLKFANRQIKKEKGRDFNIRQLKQKVAQAARSYALEYHNIDIVDYKEDVKALIGSFRKKVPRYTKFMETGSWA